MGDTLLANVQAAMGELGLPVPATVISNTDGQVAQILALAGREGREQVNGSVAWPVLTTTQTITLVNGQAAYDFPSDYAGYLTETIWNPSMRWMVQGPVSAQNWEFLKSGLINTQPWMRYRLWKGKIYFDPTPTTTNAGQTVTFEYRSKNYCQSAGGTPQRAWTADTDTFLLPDDILVLGIKWRWRSAKGFDYSQEKDDYQRALDREIARAFVGRSLPLNLATYTDPFGKGSIQDGDFPGR